MKGSTPKEDKGLDHPDFDLRKAGASRVSAEYLGLLVARMAEGDLNATSKVYRTFYNRLFRYGLVITSNHSLVEDAIQDLFIWLMEHPEQTGAIRELDVYLYQSLKRNLREKIKRTGKRLRLLGGRASENGKAHFSAPVESRMIEEESFEMDRQWLSRQLDLLPAYMKEAIFLRFYEGLEYAEIAEIMSTSNQVVRNYVSRALKRIRRNNGENLK